MTAPRLFFLLGFPVGHSLSPAMFAAAFEAAGVEARYTALSVPPSALAERFALLRESGVEGFNVTVPHKQAIVPLLDSLDPLAARVGAVNTVVARPLDGRGTWVGGGAVGYNTDVSGFLRGLSAAGGPSLAGITALVLGAGGAARAVLAALGGAGASRVTVANRGEDRARELAVWAAGEFPGTRFEGSPLVPGSLPPGGEEAGLCVQATSLGLRPHDPLPLPPALLPAGCFLYDLVYAPGGTPSVRAARELGRPATDGREMLLGQAAEAFALWFGFPAPESAMRAALERGLAAREERR